MESLLSLSSSPMVLPATVIAVVVGTIVVTVSSNYSPLARPFQTIVSRLYLSLLILLQPLYTTAYKNKNSNDDDTTSTTVIAAADNTTVVTALYKYPVKSLRTVACDDVVLDTKGIMGDRRYMIVSPAPLPLYGSFLPTDATHRFVTQRQCPILARVVVVVQQQQQQDGGGGGEVLHFSTNALSNNATCTIPVQPVDTAPIYKSTLWGDIVTVQDMGDTIATFLQRIIDADDNDDDDDDTSNTTTTNVRLVIQYVHDTRTASDKFVPPVARSLLGTNPSVHFGDGFPLLIASEASLDELNRRLKEKGKDVLPMSRFRPNIVIKGTTPFAEDRMKVIQVGKTILYVVASCARCKESCTDQLTGVVTDEPVSTMRDFRCIAPNEPDSVYFAVNAIPATNAVHDTIRVGDTVKVIQWGEPVYGDP